MGDIGNSSVIQVFKLPQILGKILENLSLEELKLARLTSKSFNTEACRIFRRTAIVCLDDLEQIKNYISFREQNASLELDLPYIQFCYRLLPTFHDLIQQLGSICRSKYTPKFYQSWSPIFEEDGQDFFSTLVQYSETMRKIDIDRCYNMNCNFPPFPQLLKNKKLPNFKLFREEWWSSKNLFEFGFQELVLDLLESAEALEDLEFGHPSLLQSVFSDDKINLKTLKKLSLETNISGPNNTPVGDTLLFLSSSKYISQIKVLRLLFWDCDAKRGLSQLLASVAPTLEALLLSATFKKDVNSGARSSLEFPKMLRLRKLWIDDPENFNFLTQENFPVLEDLRIWGIRFSANDPRIACVKRMKNIVKLQISVREEMQAHAAEYAKFLCIVPNLKKLWLCVGHTFLGKDEKLKEFLQTLFANVSVHLQEFRLTLTVFEGKQADGAWNFLTPKGDENGLFVGSTFPKMRKIELKQSYFARCSRDPGRMPKVRRHYFN